MGIFKFKIDAEITNMFFFRSNKIYVKSEGDVLDCDDMTMINKNEIYLKKTYLYITKDDDVVFKGLQIKKKSCSSLSRYIFREILVPKILAEKKIKFSKTFFRNLLTELLTKDLTLACVRYKVNIPKSYKSKSSIQCQISQMYGTGIHFLIPNRKIGVGKDKLMCTMEEFKAQNLRLEDLDLSKIWKELAYFIEKDKVIDLSNWI